MRLSIFLLFTLWFLLGLAVVVNISLRQKAITDWRIEVRDRLEALEARP